MNARQRRAGALALLALSGVFSLVFYRFNTPLGPSVGSDNAMYLTMGTALARGYAPYTQIFDHKGPLLFVIETLPQLFFGGYQTVTVFLLEWATLLTALLLLGAVCRRCGVRCAWLAQLAYLTLFAPCAGGGNLSEEYAAPLTLAGLLLLLWALDGVGKRLFWPAAGMGALGMAAFLTRANNALPLFGASLGAAACLLASGELKRPLECVLGALAGCAATLLPFVLYLAARGALGAAVYGAITHNLLYASAEGGSRVDALLHTGYGHLALLIAALGALGALCCRARGGVRAAAPVLLLGAGFSFAAAFLSHKFYQHYLTLGVPFAALGAALLPQTLGRRSPSAARAAALLLALACGVTLLASGREANAARLAEREDLPQFTADAQALYAQVPEGERDAFMAYRVEPRWYVAAKALPCMRFYFLQEILAQADPRVMDEIVRTFETAPPRWLVIYYDRPFEPPYDPRVAEIFETRYAFVDARGDYQLLRLKDEYGG